MKKGEIHMQLSKPQEEAVKTIEGQVILISCPGSGKTSTVVRRVQYMVEQGIPSDQILVLTFSRAAANEMKSRFLKLMPEGDELPPTFLKKWRWYPYSSPVLWTGSPVQAGSRGSYPFDRNTFV